MISRNNNINYGLFILILLNDFNDYLTFLKNVFFNLIEGMKKQIEILYGYGLN